MTQKKILILSEAFGSGHTKAAEAIKDGIVLLNPNSCVKVIELGSWLHPKLSQLITALYLSTIRYSPKFWGLIYRRIEHKKINPKFIYILHRLIYMHVMKLIDDFQPDAIIATHPFPSTIISRLKDFGLNVPLHTVLTDFGVHGAWVSSGVDYYYVSSNQAKDKLTYLGVAEHTIIVSGIPTNPKFWSKQNKDLIRKKLNLKNMQTVLYMGGGLGLGVTDRLIQNLSENNQIQLLIITGNNKKLFKDLKSRFRDKYPNIHLYGFVDNVFELMDASDLLITKPGGVTSAEAIEKSLPMLLLNPIPGQEEENCTYIVQNQLGMQIKDEQEISKIIAQLQKKPPYLFPSKNLVFSGKKTLERIMVNL